jgi:hypothetical protein
VIWESGASRVRGDREGSSLWPLTENLLSYRSLLSRFWLRARSPGSGSPMVLTALACCSGAAVRIGSVWRETTRTSRAPCGSLCAMSRRGPRLAASSGARLNRVSRPPKYLFLPKAWKSIVSCSPASTLANFASSFATRPLATRTSTSGNKALPKTVLIVNGSYFDTRGFPDTPIVSEGASAGPRDYDARGGAFVDAGNSAHLVDLAGRDWKGELAGARNAMVSYPLLIDAVGQTRTGLDSRWLSNRTFLGQDGYWWAPRRKPSSH